MKIFCDLDGVVWDIMGIFVEIYNEQFNENVKYEDIDSWWFFSQDCFDIVYPLTLPRIMDYPILDNFVDSHIFDLNYENDLSILTAEANTKETLKEKLESIGIYEETHYDEIIRVDHKDSKLDYEADIYIDDNPNMAKEMDKYPDRYLFLYNQPWNKSFDDSKCENVWRVSGWDAIKLGITIIKQRKGW